MSYAHHIGADQIDEPLMVPGFGALGVVPPKYVAANDNRPGGQAGVGVGMAGLRQIAGERAAREEHRKLYVWNGEGATAEAFYRPGTCCVTGVSDGRLGMPLKGASFYADDLPTVTFAPLELLPVELSGTYTIAPGSPTVEEFAKAAGLRHGDWIQTYTGRTFHPMDPRADEVHIEDIAHSLSLQCRYAGHCLRFLSVAEHSVLMAWWLYRHAGPQTALAALLHDASEAYLVDIPRPVKPFLAGYKDAEAKVMAAVCERFGLPEIPRAVKEADDRIIGDELANMKPMAWHARYDKPLGVTLAYWEPAEAEARFLSAFAALSEAAQDVASV